MNLPIFQFFHFYKLRNFLVLGDFERIQTNWKSINKNNKYKMMFWSLVLKNLVNNSAIANLKPCKENIDFLTMVLKIMPDIDLKQNVKLQLTSQNGITLPSINIFGSITINGQSPTPNSMELDIPNAIFLIMGKPQVDDNNYLQVIPIYQKIMYQIVLFFYTYYQKTGGMQKVEQTLNSYFNLADRKYVSSNGKVHDNFSQWYHELHDYILSQQEKSNLKQSLEILKVTHVEHKKTLL